MALSDTCSEVSYQLATDIVHYLNWGYGIEDISNLVDVVFLLASFQVKHDAPFMNAQEQKNGIDHMVISMFNDFLEDTDNATQIKFAEVVQANLNLKAALNTTNSGSTILVT
jgi:hypothetical protein